MAVDSLVILAVAGASSMGAVVTATKALIQERLRRKKTQVNVTSPHGEIVTITFTDSGGNTFNISPTEGEGKLLEKLVERHTDDQGNSEP